MHLIIYNIIIPIDTSKSNKKLILLQTDTDYSCITNDQYRLVMVLIFYLISICQSLLIY